MIELTDEQTAAVNCVLHFATQRKHAVVALQGPAGTGKTLTASCCAEHFEAHEFQYLAPTHKAAAVLQTQIDKRGQKGRYRVKTIHAFLGYERTIHPEDGTEHYLPPGEWVLYDAATGQPLEKLPTNREERLWKFQPSFTKRACDGLRVVFQDESSMLEEGMYDDLLRACVISNCVLILCGDKYQLPAVGHPAEFPPPQSDEILDLTVQQRTDCPHLQATFLRLRNACAQQPPFSRFRLNPDCPADQICCIRHTDYTPSPEDTFLAHTNVVVDTHNRRLRCQRFGESPSPWMVGDKVVAQKQLKCLNGSTLENGTECTLEAVSVERFDGLKVYVLHLDLEHKSLRIVHEDHQAELQKRVSTARSKAHRATYVYERKPLWNKVHALANMRASVLKHAYALTVYKSQGSTYPHVVVDYDDIARAGGSIRWRLLYVAITRASRRLTVLRTRF
jgi:DNA polymerase III delta prime subunit